MYRLMMAMGMVVAICMATGGCASSGDETTSARLTHAQFIKRADAICGKFQKSRQAKAARWAKEQPGGPSQVEANYDDGLKMIAAPSMREEAEELEGLSGPKKDTAELARMTKNFKRASKAVAAQGRQGLLAKELKDFEREAEALKMAACADPL